jgi:hypothetical protein
MLDRFDAFEKAVRRENNLTSKTIRVRSVDSIIVFVDLLSERSCGTLLSATIDVYRLARIAVFDVQRTWLDTLMVEEAGLDQAALREVRNNVVEGPETAG